MYTSNALRPLIALVCCSTLSSSVLPAASASAADAELIPLVVDTDIGTGIDDALALAAIVASERFDLVALTTCTQQAEDRAAIASRFLSSLRVTDAPVAFGRGEQAKSHVDWQIQYRRRPFTAHRAIQPDKDAAEDVIARELAKLEGDRKATILALGPLTNVARLLERHPQAQAKIERIVLAATESNVKTDVAAAKAVVASGLPLVVVPPDVAAGAALDAAHVRKLFAAQTALTLELQGLYELWLTKDAPAPPLSGAVAVRLAYDENFAPTKRVRLEVADDGQLRAAGGEPNAMVATSIDAAQFANDYAAQVTAFGKGIPFIPPKNASKLVERGGLPKVVHAFEDYDTDIEKRWWLAGKLELDELPEGSRRAQRATITQNFDDLQGDRQARYRAVIFNPVPGPPMGPRTRLAFRYKLRGADMIRVQLYTLSNGYHRYLSVSDLPQNEWREATVDMTAMRRADGTGGPLAADERIDDIQFYVDPRAELIVDSMVLYEAADEDERRPFPRRLLFTGWFDTGSQGAEWPGDFEIVAQEKPRTWDAAQSVVNKETGRPWIRLHLRGERRLAPRTDLRFRYRLTGADEIKVVLRNSRTKQELPHPPVSMKENEWSEASLTFELADGPSGLTQVDEIQFQLPESAELRIDDVLLFEPGFGAAEK